MGRSPTGSRMCGRVWHMCEEETPTLILRNNYYSMYNEMPAKNFTSFTQKLVGSGMFIKKGWVNIKTGVRYETKNEGERRDTYLILERKPMEQIIEPYITNTNTIRKMRKLPKFVRDEIEKKRGELNE